MPRWARGGAAEHGGSAAEHPGTAPQYSAQQDANVAQYAIGISGAANVSDAQQVPARTLSSACAVHEENEVQMGCSLCARVVVEVELADISQDAPRSCAAARCVLENGQGSARCIVEVEVSDISQHAAPTCPPPRCLVQNVQGTAALGTNRLREKEEAS